MAFLFLIGNLTVLKRLKNEKSRLQTSLDEKEQEITEKERKALTLSILEAQVSYCEKYNSILHLGRVTKQKEKFEQIYGRINS